MRKKGFTLIEMLAVVVLLGVIMMIAVPNILKTYNNSKETAFKMNIEKLYDAAEVYRSEYELLYGKVLRNVTLEIIDGNIEGDPLSIKGRLPEIGKIIIDENGKISVSAYDGGFCGERIYTDNEVTVKKMKKEDCYLYNLKDYEILANDFSILRETEIDLKDYAYLARYNKRVEDAEITYTSNPEFNSSNVGKYEVTYKSIYKDKTYEKKVTVTVEKDDFVPPTLIATERFNYFKTSGNVTITANDLLGLSSENKYQYYLSTSSEELLNGTWNDYISGESFSIEGTNETKYLWVYPVSDLAGNINDNHTSIEEPYIIGEYVFDTDKPTITISDPPQEYAGSLDVTLTIKDTGLSGLSDDNKYYYYFSTSSTELVNGSWIQYESGKDFTLSGMNETKYLWIYPISDRALNINDNYTDIESPYIIESYKFAVPFTLTINLNGGVNNLENSYMMYPGDTIDLGTPTKEGYTFIGWTKVGDSSSLDDTLFTMGTENTTITANWRQNIYTIVYDCNGGSGSTESSVHRHGISEKLSSNGCYKINAGNSTDSTPMAYGFLGWSEDENATTATYTDMQSVMDLTTNEELTLYAVWKELFAYDGKYSVIDDGNGDWRVKFLENGTFIPNTNMTIDAFLVGGGAGGKSCSTGWGGPGGGGGYTTTKEFIGVTAGTPWTITIGSGGGVGAAGGVTKAFNETANGGKVGGNYTVAANKVTYYGCSGGAGGSGGGGSIYRGGYGHANTANNSTSGYAGGVGGSNGSGGNGAWSWSEQDGDVGYLWYNGSGGAGQIDPTTREFKTPVTKVYIVGTALTSNWLSLTSGGAALTPQEGYIYSVMTTGDYYYRDFIWNGSSYVETDLARVYGSGGGAGAPYNSSAGKGYHGAASGASNSSAAVSATPNTGGGGGGASYGGKSASAGASGIVIIRNSKEPLDLEYTYTGESKLINDGNGDWRIKFLSSGTLILDRDREIDLFLVGEGGDGGAYAGGGGGVTKTVLGVSVTGATEYEIVVGADATGDGNPSTAFGYKADGGKQPQGTTGYGANGGSGGGGYSGGAGGVIVHGSGGLGGYNGSDGGGGNGTTVGGGTGLNKETGTREFWEAHGDLYSGGGGGSWGGAGGAGGGGTGARDTVNVGTNGVKNTGGGGGGGGGKSGSGIVIIRNKR